MSNHPEGRFFPAALLISALAHATVPFLPGEKVVVPADFEVEERQALEPMTVRILTQERDVAPTPVPLAPDPLMTSQDGPRAIETIDFEPQSFERRQREPQPIEKLMADEPPPEDIEPEPEIEPLPEPDPPQAVEPPPPEEIELPEKIEPVQRDIDIPSGPVEQVAQSGVRSRATQVKGRNRTPDYPRRAEALNMEGTTVLSIVIQPNGKVGRIEVFKSSGHKLLDDEAVKHVKRWRFNPAKDSDGNPVADAHKIPIVWDLTEHRRRRRRSR